MKKLAIISIALAFSFLIANMLFAADDTIPDPFIFTDRTDVALNTEFKSNTITVSGIDAASPISITGGTYSINGAAFTSASGTVNLGNTVKVRKVSAASYSTTESATLTIGTVSDTFSVTTLIDPADTTPDPFHFTDRTNVALSTEYKSNAITVAGINTATPISVVGGTYSINGGAYTSASGTVSLGNTVKVRKMSSSSYATTKNATLTIGGISDTFSVTTEGEFKVAFVSLGGSLTAEQSVESGGYATAPANPTRAGYTFSGWYKTLKYDIPWNYNSDVVTANTAIYPKWTRTNPETFLEADRPAVVLYDQGQTYYYGIRLPWNYDKAYNSTRKYPLQIALHTGGGPMSTPTPPTDYPCLVLSPKLPDDIGFIWTADALAWFVTIIDKVLTDYRIDTDRIFISGFSQGGAGSYQIANALYNHNGRIFASISRADGSGGFYTLPDGSLSKTCVHLRIGLQDYSGSVTSIRNAYNLIKNHSSNIGATEITYNCSVTSGSTTYHGTSWLIVKDGIERARKTEFSDMGHDDLYDSSIFPWFYNQSIDH